MALRLAIAPRQREGSPDGSQVVAQALRETSNLRCAALGQTLEPTIELPWTPPMHKSQELTRKAANLGDHRFDLAQRLHEPLVVDMLGLVECQLSPSTSQPKARRTDGHGSVRAIA